MSLSSCVRKQKASISPAQQNGHPREWPFCLIPWAFLGAGDRTRTGDILLGSSSAPNSPFLVLQNLPADRQDFCLQVVLYIGSANVTRRPEISYHEEPLVNTPKF